jgi:hypothetical protein
VTAIPYHILPTADGWRVSARGFTWNFRTQSDAVAFALSTADDYTRATGQATSVRLQQPDGRFHELRAYDGGIASDAPWSPTLAVAR